MSIKTLSPTEQTASWLLQRLEEHQTPMSFQELESGFATQKGLSNRILKETAWKLVEEGKIKFTSSWDLEVV
jgi:hypothetical protein